MDMTSRPGLVVLNTCSTSTFTRPSYRQTIIDVSLASKQLAKRIEDWRVIEDFTGSDHQYIMFRVCDVRSIPKGNIAKMDAEKLPLALKCGQGTLSKIPPKAGAIRVMDIIMHWFTRYVLKRCRGLSLLEGDALIIGVRSFRRSACIYADEHGKLGATIKTQPYWQPNIRMPKTISDEPLSPALLKKAEQRSVRIRAQNRHAEVGFFRSERIRGCRDDG